MTEALGSARFHVRHAWFNTREQFSDVLAGIAGFLLFPFFVWIIGQLWRRFNSYQGHFTVPEVLTYVAVAEALFMTFLPPATVTRAASDFSLALARPRSWLATSFSGIYGRCLGARLIYVAILAAFLPLIGVDVADALRAAGRLLLFLPLLGIVQGLLGTFFASAKVMWEQTNYLYLPVSKIFLALGGVFAPLIDYGSPWDTRLIALPPSDLFFQPAYFCIRGEFYQLTTPAWLLRVGLETLVLFVLARAFFAFARRHHQSYGG